MTGAQLSSAVHATCAVGSGSDGTRDKPFCLILPESSRSELADYGYADGDLLHMTFGWWRIVFNRHIPTHTNEG